MVGCLENEGTERRSERLKMAKVNSICEGTSKVMDGSVPSVGKRS